MNTDEHRFQPVMPHHAVFVAHFRQPSNDGFALSDIVLGILIRVHLCPSVAKKTI
jgi:hypothetical protein